MLINLFLFKQTRLKVSVCVGGGGQHVKRRGLYMCVLTGRRVNPWSCQEPICSTGQCCHDDAVLPEPVKTRTNGDLLLNEQ